MSKPLLKASVSGFTLLEVLIAFSLLAILLTVILQSQAETTYFLEKTGKQQLVQREVINTLSATERSCAAVIPSSDAGTFTTDHELAGDRWQREAVSEMFMGMIPFTRVTYRILWNNPRGGADLSFESSIYCGR